MVKNSNSIKNHEDFGNDPLMSIVPLEKDHLKIHYVDYNFEDGSFIKEIEINNDGYLLEEILKIF